jgi:cell division protein FtsB
MWQRLFRESPWWWGVQALAAAAALGLVCFGGTYSWWDVRAGAVQLEATREAVMAAGERVDSLTAALQALEDDVATQVAVARARYGVVGAGEVVVVAIDEASTGVRN